MGPPMRYDFKAEARITAVNEACIDETAIVNCTLDEMCPDCRRLAGVIEGKLRSAYFAGQRSASEVGG